MNLPESSVPQADIVGVINIVLLFDGEQQPFWVLSAVKELQEQTSARIIKAFIYSAQDQSESLPPLYRVYQAIDHRQSQHIPDFCRPDTIRTLFDQSLTVLFSPDLQENPWISLEYALQSQVEPPIDVVVYFGRKKLPLTVLTVPRYGVWVWLSHSKQALSNEVFWSVFNHKATADSALWMQRGNSDQDCIIYRSYVPVNRFSVIQTESLLMGVSSRFLCRKINDLYKDRQHGLDPMEHISSPFQTETCLPTTRRLVRPLLSLASSYGTTKLRDRISPARWMIAYRFGGSRLLGDLDTHPLTYLQPPDGYQWADPFPWIQNGNPFVFVEEIPRSEKKGHIAVLNLAQVDPAEPQATTIINQEYHMSYPFLFSWRESLYMMPETSANHCVEIYRCRQFPYEWELHTRFFENIEASDSTLAQIGGLWWLFTYQVVEGVRANNELYLYYADNPFGPWTPHERNPVISDARVARPAGGIFHYRNHYCRPAQDCSTQYGYAVVVREIVALTPKEYAETTLATIYPNWAPRLQATHTLNCYHNLMTIDGYQRTTRLRRSNLRKKRYKL